MPTNPDAPIRRRKIVPLLVAGLALVVVIGIQLASRTSPVFPSGWTPAASEVDAAWVSAPNFAPGSHDWYLTSQGPLCVNPPGQHPPMVPSGPVNVERVDHTGIAETVPPMHDVYLIGITEGRNRLWTAFTNGRDMSAMIVGCSQEHLSALGDATFTVPIATPGFTLAKGHIEGAGLLRTADGHLLLLYTVNGSQQGGSAFFNSWMMRIDPVTHACGPPVPLPETLQPNQDYTLLPDGTLLVYSALDREELYHVSPDGTRHPARLPIWPPPPPGRTAKLLASSKAIDFDFQGLNYTASPRIKLAAIFAHPELATNPNLNAPPMSLTDWPLYLRAKLADKSVEEVLKEEGHIADVWLETGQSPFGIPLDRATAKLIEGTLMRWNSDGLFLFSLDPTHALAIQLAATSPPWINEGQGFLRTAILEETSTSVTWDTWVALPVLPESPRQGAQVRVEVVASDPGWTVYLIGEADMPLAWTTIPIPAGVASPQQRKLTAHPGPLEPSTIAP
ncbi:MAG: hypothetical protein ABI743_09290 [bacterium]